MKTCVIIAGGEFHTKFASLYIKQKYKGNRPDLVIAADTGMQYALDINLIPDLIVGDYDSVNPEILKQVSGMENVRNLRFPPEKNYTDTHLALVSAIREKAEDICVLAATGTRLDHVQANIGLLKTCMDTGIAAELVDPYNRIRMIRDSLTIEKEKQFGTQVSLIPYSDQVTGITLQGFYYPLCNAVFSKNTYHQQCHYG